jgi:hypothetical protein
MDLPSATSRDESSIRETTGASLPPLVATLPPVAQPIYLPAAVRNAWGRGWTSRASLNGALVALAMSIVLGGVVVGRRIVSAEGPAVPGNSAAFAAAPPAVAAPALPAAVQGPVQPVEATGGSELTPVTTVESLPRATAPAVQAAPQRPAPPAVAVQSAGPAQNTARPTSAAPSPSPASPAPVAKSAARDERNVVHDDAKDLPETEESHTASAENAAPATAIVPQTPAEVQEDPLVKAVREDIKEEESRRR